MFALEKSASADDFSLRSDDVRPVPFLPSPILPTRLSVLGRREEDGGIALRTCRKLLHRSFGAGTFCFSSPPWKESCNPVVSRTERARSPSLTLHASRQEGKQRLRRRFVRQLRQKELANGWLGDRLAAHLRIKSSDSGSKRHFLQRSWSDDDRNCNRGGAGHWWAWGLLHDASGPGDHRRPGVGPEDHRGDGGHRSSPRLYSNPISRWEQPSGRHHSAQDSVLWTPRPVPEVQEVWAHGQSLHYTTISSVGRQKISSSSSSRRIPMPFKSSPILEQQKFSTAKEKGEEDPPIPSLRKEVPRQEGQHEKERPQP